MDLPDKEVDPSKLININIGVLGHIDSGKTSLCKALSTISSTASMDKSPQSKELLAAAHACDGGVTQEQVDAVMDDFAVGLEDLLIDHSETPEPWIDGAAYHDGPSTLAMISKRY